MGPSGLSHLGHGAAHQALRGRTWEIAPNCPEGLLKTLLDQGLENLTPIPFTLAPSGPDDLSSGAPPPHLPGLHGSKPPYPPHLL